MAAEDQLGEWLEAEQEAPPPRLGDLLERLGQEAGATGRLGRYLRLKLEEDRLRTGHQERRRVLRALSWRFVWLVLLLGLLGLVAFSLAGADAFEAALFFFAGAAAYYLLIQTVVALRLQRDDREAAERYTRLREEIRAEGGGAVSDAAPRAGSAG